MSRSPTPWLLGDTSHDRTAAPAVGNPNLRLNQLQPGGCTQLHHLNEAMPFRTAGRTSSSWSHRRAPTYLRRSHMPLYSTYKHLPLEEWRSVASGCPSKPNGTKWNQMDDRGHRCKSAEGHLCCYILLRRIVQATCDGDQLTSDDPPPTTPPPPSSPPTLCSHCAFILNEDT